jgi:hypothetical protein
MAVGDIITAARYNNAQARVASIMGTGSSTEGYGQTLASSQTSLGQTVTSTQINNLYTDIVAGRIHQVGTLPATIFQVNSGDIIADETSDDTPGNVGSGQYKGFTDFESLIGIFESTGERFKLHLDQSSTLISITGSITANWNSLRTHIVRATFVDADARRHFFNSGGTINFTAELAGYSGAKSVDWANMLSAMGTIKFDYTSTYASGSGTGTNIGNFDLTSTYQQVFTKIGSGVYVENDYNIKAKAISTNVIEFLIEFRDDNAPGGYGIDENVNGTLTSRLGTTRASGLYVNVAAPTLITTDAL